MRSLERIRAVVLSAGSGGRQPWVPADQDLQLCALNHIRLSEPLFLKRRVGMPRPHLLQHSRFPNCGSAEGSTVFVQRDVGPAGVRLAGCKQGRERLQTVLNP